MPGYDTHYLFGVHSYRKMTDETITKKCIRDHKGIYTLGLFGPDIFFYYATEVVAARKNIGSIMHTAKTDIFFKNMLSYIDVHRGQARDIAIAYYCGFISHYILDCIMHPYVYWRTDYLHKEKNYLEKHFTLESDIDIQLLKNYKNTTPYDFMKNSSFELNEMELGVVCDMLYYSIRTTYHDSRITRPGIKMAIYSIQKEQRLMKIASKKVNRMLTKVSDVMGNKRYMAPFIPSDEVKNDDPLNIKHDKWYNPWDLSKVSTESVPDMLNKGEKRFNMTMFLLDNYLDADLNNNAAYRTLVAFIGCKSYHSGLNCRIPS